MQAKRQRLQGIRILHEDSDLFVIEKAAGILSQSTRRGDERSVESVLTDYVRKGQWKSSKRVYLVHRLDRETSGVMVVAKTEAVQDYFRSRWNEITTKVYLARVDGLLAEEQGVFESYLREDENYFVRSVKNPAYGKLARTEWRQLAVFKSRRNESTLVEVTLKSGRKNQIRVHFSEAGHPVLGDAKYGHGRRGDDLCLHAWKLSFVHPRDGREMNFEVPPPAFANMKLENQKGNDHVEK